MTRRRLRSWLPILVVTSTVVHAGDVTLPDFERIQLDSGTILLLAPKADVPLVSVTAMLRAGAVTDPKGLNGLASLFASMLEKGAGDRDAAQFADAVDSAGGILTAVADLEVITISGNFLSRDADLMIGLLADMLQHPALDETELEKLRERRINFIRAAKDSNLNALLPIYGSAFLFGDHAYGNPVSGSEATLAEIGHEDLLDFYEQQLGGNRLVIAVSGDFDQPSMRTKLAGMFDDWRPAAASPPQIPAMQPLRGRRVLLIDKPEATQTYFWLGNIGVARDYDDRAALDIANTVFGGQYTSMLNTALRMESGLTYGARSILQRHTRPGSIAISSYTRNDATVEAIDIALAELEKLHDKGIAAGAIDAGRNYLLGQFPTMIETSAQVGAQLAAVEAYGLDVSYITEYGTRLVEADRDAIRATIDAVFPVPEDLVLVLLGDAEAIRDGVARYGPVTEIAIAEPRFRLPAAPAGAE